MRITIERDDREPMQAEVEDLRAVRACLFAFQEHTEATNLTARDEQGRELARMTFEWADE